MSEPTTLTALLRERIAEPGAADRAFVRRDGPDGVTAATPVSYADFGADASRLAHLLRTHRRTGAPFHVGVAAANSPDWLVALGGCLLSGATLVGLNTTRGAAELRRDIDHTGCRVVLGDTDGLAAVAAAEPRGTPRVQLGPALTAAAAGLPSTPPDVAVGPDDLAFLIFTSGTTSAPKAVRRSHGHAIGSVRKLADRVGVGADDVGYACTPLFHAAALLLVVLPAMLRAASVYVTPFTVSGFHDDIRRHGCTWMGYTGTPLTYLLTAPARPDDAALPFRVAIGNEGNSAACDAFAARFGCRVIDSYGATEGGIGVVRETGDPPGALGRPPEGVTVVDAEGEPCPPAQFDAGGRITNAEAAVGEIVNLAGVNVFEGYWHNREATDARGGGGIYRSGDLGYRDGDGYLYFAGRADDWLRVDGENFPAHGPADLLRRHPDVLLAAVFAVPAATAGDQVMAVLQRRPGTACDPAAVLAWMGAQPDCGSKWLPRYVRVVDDVPLTASHKVRVRDLRREGFRAPGTLERDADGGLAPVDIDAAVAALDAAGRGHLLDL